MELSKYSGDQESSHKMPAINEPSIIANDLNLVPLARTWYEKEVEASTTRTFRFAKRTDHTGVLIRINTAEFLDEFG